MQFDQTSHASLLGLPGRGAPPMIIDDHIYHSEPVQRIGSSYAEQDESVCRVSLDDATLSIQSCDLQLAVPSPIGKAGHFSLP